MKIALIAILTLAVFNSRIAFAESNSLAMESFKLNNCEKNQKCKESKNWVELQKSLVDPIVTRCTDDFAHTEEVNKSYQIADRVGSNRENPPRRNFDVDRLNNELLYERCMIKVSIVKARIEAFHEGFTSNLCGGTKKSATNPTKGAE
jgi:hypothetical protein